MQLADLTLFQSVVEVRYASAYLLWDRSGELWSKLRLRLQGLRMISAEPNQTVFRVADAFEFGVKLESASLNAFRPNRTLTQFCEHAGEFFPLASEMLEVAEFSRVGCWDLHKGVSIAERGLRGSLRICDLELAWG
jgi:hypothetical protein